ncbi:hypothetical protein FSP39_018554 [Pinctada imbricata]|uniref:Uncharacterized protein n=1 Tax=Pinctada imbricata TaxID=66713 RepID=A0AA89BRH2_PINIB|nr:hypothetical protein FSP39_018554 [Pinctada imbricata]
MSSPTAQPTYQRRTTSLPALDIDKHNHTADHAGVVAKQIMDQVKRRCVEEVNPVTAIYTSELLKLRDRDWDDVSKQVVERLPTFNSSKSSLYRARRKTTPALPKTQSSITLDGKWTDTATGDRFLLIDESHHSQRTIVYATDNNLRDLAAADTIYCDRTFTPALPFPPDIHNPRPC